MTVRTRVYLPASVAVLRTLAAGDSWRPPAAFAVTPRSRAELVDPDEEELEFAAFLDAARASHHLLQPEDPPRRLVVSADVPAAGVSALEDEPATAVSLAVAVRPADVVAFHVDDVDGARVVQAVRAGADPGGLDDVALAWFDTSELGALLAEVDPQGR